MQPTTAALPKAPEPGTTLHRLTVKHGRLTVSDPLRVESREYKISAEEFVWDFSRCNVRHLWEPGSTLPIAGTPKEAPLGLCIEAIAFIYCRPEHLMDAARAIRGAWQVAAVEKAKEAEELGRRLRNCAVFASSVTQFGGGI